MFTGEYNLKRKATLEKAIKCRLTDDGNKDLLPINVGSTNGSAAGVVLGRNGIDDVTAHQNKGLL